MTMRLSHRCAQLVATVLTVSATTAFASGDDNIYVNPFASQFQPARLINYASGNLGVVQGDYWRLNLFLAYKAATGKPLTAQNIAALAPNEWRVGPAALALYPHDPERNGTGSWLAMRAKYASALTLPEAKEVGFLSDAVDFESYVNCHPDAFRQAALTLEARAAGKPDAWTRQWVLGQDAVFANCEEPPHPYGQPKPPRVVQLPPALPKGAPDWLQFDHAYQSAAANFYGRKHDTARAQFQAIARQGKSPWRSLGNYLAARTLIRKATLEYPLRSGQVVPGEREKLLVQARQELVAMSATYPAAQRMVALVDARIDPTARIAVLARILDKEPFGADTPALLSDYLVLLDGQQNTDTIEAREALTAWIGNMQAPPQAMSDAAGAARVLALATLRASWLKQPDALWLAPLLTLAQDGDLSEAEKKAAAAVAPTHPLYLTLQYNLARLAIAGKDLERADKTIDRLLAAHGKTMSVATTNRFLALKMTSTASFDGFLQASQRRLETIGEPGDTSAEPHSAAQTGDDFARVILRMLPMRDLKALIKHPKLPAAWKPKLEETLFTRALIFNDEASALDLLDAMAKGRKSTAHLYARYRSAAAGAERKLAGQIILVNTPELEPAVLGTSGHFRYWGCNTPSNKFAMEDSEAAPQPLVPRFLTPEQVAEADKEHKRMMALPLRSEYVAPALLAWAGSKPADEEAPKALHLLVASTRMECLYGASKPEKEQQRARYSRAAFDMLKQDYRDSKWSKATKYFY
jgi:hypothetical protein